MAKKDKNSLLNIHYSRTLTPDNLSKAANYVGGYVLKGLGAFSKFLNAGFTSPTYGTTGQVSYARNVEDAKRLKELSEASEQAMGKAMTWVSPLNYGAAVWNGHGLNAKKGEEEVASWSPAWQAVGRLGELYVGPKAVKGVKSAPRVVVNTAAKAGSKTAKKAVVAREIKLNVKNTLPELSNRTVSVNRDVNAFTGKPDLTYTLYNEFGEPIGQTNIGSAAMGLIERKGSRSLDRMVDGIYSKNKAHKVSEDTYNVAVLDVIDNGGTGIESGWSLMSPLKTLAVTSKFPNTVIGLEFGNPVRLLTGRSSRPMPLKVLGNHYLEIKPKTEIKFNEATGEFEEVPTTLSRLISLDTYPLYRGPLFSIKSIVNSDGTVNPRQAMKVLHTIADWFGNKAHRMESRLENPEWHKTDPTTFHHTKLVAQSAWRIPTPLGFTKYDQMVAALGHDFGKIVSGDGHAQIGADLAKLIFPDMTEALYKAIAEHMGVPVTSLGKATKMADMRNGIVVRDINGKTRILLPTHTNAKPREFVIDPQGDNKYYVHMRVWDDVGKHVPGNISDIEKGNLFQTLYESLPDNAEILFPKSGPGNYGTRGTVAGLQRLSRDPRFTPGTKGTLQYLDKDGKTIKTYEGTSFIKTPKLQSLKQGGKINILEFLKNGGQVRKMQTASGGPIKLYDTLWVDNWKNRLTSPTVVAKQLTELTSKIPIKYLGGSKNNVRKEFWKQEPVFQHAVDSIANQYGISPESLKYRLDREGFTDRLIQRRNARIKIGALRFEPRGYELLNNPNYGLAGTQIGLDDAKTYIDSGKVKLINENWYEQGPFKNEKGRMTYPVNPVTLNDGMGIVAAHLKYFRDEALLDFPNGSEYDLDRYANAYYNRGTYGGKKWVLAGAKGYSYRKKGGMLEFLKNGSGIHIKEKNRGKFTSYCGGKVTDECIRKAKASGNPTLVKRATFAANARKWKHEDGGCFSLLGRIVKKHQTGGKTNFFNSLAGLAVISGITSLISTAALNKKVQADAEALKALNEADWAEIEKEIIQLNLLKRNQRYQLWISDYLSGRTMDQPSLIVAEHEGSEELNQELAEGKQGLKNRNKQIDTQANAETSGNWGNTITGILQNGLGMVGNYMANKGANNAAPSTSGGSVYKLDSFWSNPTLKTNYNFLNQ